MYVYVLWGLLINGRPSLLAARRLAVGRMTLAAPRAAQDSSRPRIRWAGAPFEARPGRVVAVGLLRGRGGPAGSSASSSAREASIHHRRAWPGPSWALAWRTRLLAEARRVCTPSSGTRVALARQSGGVYVDAFCGSFASLLCQLLAPLLCQPALLASALGFRLANEGAVLRPARCSRNLRWTC